MGTGLQRAGGALTAPRERVTNERLGGAEVRGRKIVCRACGRPCLAEKPRYRVTLVAPTVPTHIGRVRAWLCARCYKVTAAAWDEARKEDAMIPVNADET